MGVIDKDSKKGGNACKVIYQKNPLELGPFHTAF